MSRQRAGNARTGSVLGLASVAFLVGVGPLAGVQSPDRPVGWLGVRVAQGYECEWESSADSKECQLVIDISEVQDGGPAHRGGLEPGDRMVAINGQDLTFLSWDPLRESIRAGTPVSIDVMRESNRHFVRVTPEVRTAAVEGGRWVGPARRSLPRVTVAGRPSVFVVTLTELDRTEGGAAFAITVRDTEDRQVAFEPAALRVLDGQLRLVPLSEEVFVELPSLRREIMGTLRGITDSSYERASNAVQVVENIRARLPSDDDLRQRLSRIAQLGLEEVELATTFSRSWAGAQFVPAGRNFATAVDAERGGLLVLRVIANTPAERLGLREGDIVFQAGDRPVREFDDLQWAVESADGDLEIRWMRKTTQMSATYRR